MSIPAEVWLRGPIDGIQPLLQPAAHAIVQTGEDILPLIADLSHEQLWLRPGGAASIGFHVAHLPGSLDRLLTYSRGDGLSEAQFVRLHAERTLHDTRPDLAAVSAQLTYGIAAAIDYLRTVPQEALLEPRAVGRARLPSNMLGLIFHAAEHSSRHAGQIVTLTSVVRSGGR